MKSVYKIGIALIISFSFLSFSQAIVVADCPSSFDVSLSMFKSMGLTDSTSLRIPALPRVAQNYLQVIKSFQGEFVKVEGKNAVCTYQGPNQARATLRGSTVAGAKEPAFLRISWDVLVPAEGEFAYYLKEDAFFSYSAVIPMDDKSLKDGVVLKYPSGSAKLSIITDYCDSGECMSWYFKIGEVFDVQLRIL